MNADDLADDGDLSVFRSDDDRLHDRVGRLQADMVRFLEELFKGGFAVQHGYDGVPVVCGRLGMHQGQVAIQYAGIDHGVASDPQEETTLALDGLLVNQEVALNVLNGRRQMSGPDGADYWEGDGSTARTGQGNPAVDRIQLEVTLLLQGHQVLGDGQIAADTQMLGDLPLAGGIAIVIQVGRDELQNLQLSGGGSVISFSPNGIHMDTIHNISAVCQ